MNRIALVSVSVLVLGLFAMALVTVAKADEGKRGIGIEVRADARFKADERFSTDGRSEFKIRLKEHATSSIHATSSVRAHKAGEGEGGRPAWMNILSIAGFKNLGEVRSLFARSEHSLERLRAQLASTTDAEVRTALEARIAALENKATTTKEFMLEHEGRFSFLGWFARLFVKSE